MKKENIFSTGISAGSYQQFLQEIFTLTEKVRSSYVCFANVHMIVEAHNNKRFNDIINGADLVAPDGRPLSIFLKLFKGLKQPRICGMDLLPDLLEEANEIGKSVYFYGTTNDVLERMVARASKEYPLLEIAGYYSPPFRELTANEKSDVTKMINEARPDLVFVSLGCPKQEKWMAENRGKINSCMLGLGQAFHVYAGKEKRVPKWMRNLSLEWAYRLILEPKRLWKRYAYTNSTFLFLVFRYLMGKRYSPANAASPKGPSLTSVKRQT